MTQEKKSDASPFRSILGCVLASGILFFASLCFPVFYLGEGGSDCWGIAILLLGWMGVPGALGGNFTYVPWLANPLLLASLILMLTRRYSSALVASATALLLGLASANLKSVLVNEAGGTSPIAGYGADFYLWLCALSLPFVTSILLVHFAIMQEISGSRVKDKP